MQVDILKKKILQTKIKSYLRNTMMFLIELETKSKKISGNECDYEKDYIKIKFNSGDDLSLNKQLKFHNMIITIRSVFEENSTLYPQVFLDDTLYELNIEYERIDISEGIDINKTNLSKECDICH